jgi:hypothetical protein
MPVEGRQVSAIRCEQDQPGALEILTRIMVFG